MSRAGWYPDPGGQAGMYRYWDGSAWAPTISPTPGGPAPVTTPGTQPLGGRGGLVGGTFGGQPGSAQAGVPGGYQLPPDPGQERRSPWGLVIGGLVLLALIGLIGFQVLRPGGPLDSPARDGRGGQPTENVCPRPKSPRTIAHPNDGRVHGGMISYPKLGAPWGEPETDNRLPFGLDVREQVVVVEPNYNATSSWVASVLVAELNAGDGFYAAEEGANIVAKCVLGAFYGDNKVERQDVTSKAVTIDGHEGWQLEMHLTFDIKGLKVKGETAIIVVVDTGQTAAALYYASIPDSRPELLQTARDLIGQLRIGP